MTSGQPRRLNSAELYDIFNDGIDDDVALYVTLARDANLTLELGVGTGRIAIPLAKSGNRVIGVDYNPTMLERLTVKAQRERREAQSLITIVHEDFRCLSEKSGVDLVLYPFCAFNFLLAQSDGLESLLSLAQAVGPGVKVVFDLLTLNTFPLMGRMYEETVQWTVPWEGMEIDISMVTEFDQSKQVLHQERHFSGRDTDSDVVPQTVIMENRLMMPGEVELLLEKAHYTIEGVFGDYELNSFRPDSTSLIVIARTGR